MVLAHLTPGNSFPIRGTVALLRRAKFASGRESFTAYGRLTEARNLPSAEELVTRFAGNHEKILRYAFIPQVLAGLLLLGLAYYMGHVHFHLIRQGVRAPGTIVGYKQENFRRSSVSSSTGYMPIVEFHTNDRFIQFQDWLGASARGSTNTPVIVLYDPVNPSVAMIDRPVWNWIPWGPILAVGLFLVLVAVRGAFRSLSV